MDDSSNGRTNDGRFAEGHTFSKGGHAKRAARFRRALTAAVSPADVHNVARALLDKAKGGDVPAIKLVLEYTVGKPTTTVAVDAGGGMSIDEAFRALWGIKIPDATTPSAFRS